VTDEMPATDPREDRRLRTSYVLLGLSLAAALVTLVGGIWFIAADPAPGTERHDVLGITAASAGIVTGLLFAGWGIYTSWRNLWSRIPLWIRNGVIGLLIGVVVLSFLID
jgi:hypothetical protein